MANDPDLILLETVKTHRDRMRSALVHGRIEERRTVNDNIRRFLASVIVAALICGICVGISFVASVLTEQREEQQRVEQERDAAFGHQSPAETDSTSDSGSDIGVNLSTDPDRSAPEGEPVE